MAIRTILHHPDPRLRRISEPVARVDDTVRSLVDDMAETMYGAPGIGLAAIQIDVTQRVLVIDVSEERQSLQVFINPEILSRDGQQITVEGCLSVPGVFEPVSRAERVRIRALDRNGQSFEIDASGLLAACVQHEIDHLDGKIFVDYLSRLKQDRLRKKLEKQQRLAM
jgi:peptide deformylase